MSNHNQPVSLGDVVRYMAEQALKSENRSYHVPIHLIARQMYGLTADDMGRINADDLEAGGKYSVAKLKASYVSNTVARMPEIQAANVRAKLSIKDGDFGDDVDVRCAYITLVDGAIQTGTRRKGDAEKEAAIVERFKARLLKITPNVIDLQGEQKEGALIALARYHEMIKETK